VLEPALEVARHAGRGRAGEAARQLGLAHPRSPRTIRARLWLARTASTSPLSVARSSRRSLSAVARFPRPGTAVIGRSTSLVR
ncbi:MAG TPA: hypothetical protein VHS30_33555, partial [Streptosporangiaceae bacterium]|nr:hypothetical protein [Streptosporangiaceae bacterium]